MQYEINKDGQNKTPERHAMHRRVGSIRSSLSPQTGVGIQRRHHSRQAACKAATPGFLMILGRGSIGDQRRG